MAKILFPILISAVRSIVQTCIQSIEETADKPPVEEIMDSQVLDAKLEEQLQKLRKDVEKMNLVSFVQEYETLVIRHIRWDLEKEKEIEKLVQEAVRQIRDAIEYAEDIVDTYLISVEKQNRRNRLAKLVHIFDRLKKLHEVKQKVQVIKEFIREINSFIIKINEKETYNSLRTESSSEKADSRERLKEDDEIVVGLDHDTEVLLKGLLGESAKLEVVSIFGRVGAGKTTLAKKIYNDDRVKNHFEFRAWIDGSDEHMALQAIATFIDPKWKDDSNIVLVNFIFQYLKNKRFLLVIDDVWSEEVRDKIVDAVPHHFNASRILITSRSERLAYAIEGTTPYPMPFLNMEDSWVLLTWKVFQGSTIPPELEPIAKEIVEHCHGLPMAIVTVAAACKGKTLVAWEELLEKLKGHQGEKDILEVLAQITVSSQRAESKSPKKSHEMESTGEISEVEGSLRVEKQIRDGLSTESTSRERIDARELLNLSRRNVEEDEGVGLDDDTEVLVERLLEESAELQVVSITGMGGAGKTTLAKKIYNHSRVKNHFHCRAWAYVSQEYKIEDLVREIWNSLKPISEEDSSVDKDDQLKERTLKHQRNKRFLLVTDDICSTKLWDEIRYALPNDSNGSRILITSRNKKLALYASLGTPPYSMPFLNKEESWELFTRKVFRGDKIPLELEDPGREIVQRCCGLPISVATVAALAASKEKNFETWSNLVQNLDSQLTYDETVMLDVLALSYNNLPWRLRLCFLYMAAYPKGFVIPVRQLIQLWMAEGFIQYTEKDGEDYLAELIDENLILVSSRRTDGGVKTCHIHDMLRLLCLSESKNDKFLHVCTDDNIFSMTKPRRLSLHCSPSLYISANPPHASSIRSLLCFTPDMHPFERRQWKWLRKSFKLIRVLNLGRLKVKAIPDSIGKLVVLKYLKVESEELKVIPASIGNILYLQTLDLRLSSLNVFPDEIWKLKELRHVYVLGPVILPHLHLSEDHSYPRSLQGLSTVALDENIEKLLKKGVFLNLRKLGLWYKPYSKCNPSEALACLGNLNHLRTLKNFGTSDLPRSYQSFPRNLTKITLGEIEYLPSRTTRTLEELPELRILKLVGCKNSGAMKKFSFNCNANGFPQLQVLQMSSLHMEEWNLWEGAMPHLQNLVIRDCTYLTVLPYRLWGLTYIQQIQVSRPSTKLAENLRELQVKDKSKLLVDPPLESAFSSKDW